MTETITHPTVLYSTEKPEGQLFEPGDGHPGDDWYDTPAKLPGYTPEGFTWPVQAEAEAAADAPAEPPGE